MNQADLRHWPRSSDCEHTTLVPLSSDFGHVSSFDPPFAEAGVVVPLNEYIICVVFDVLLNMTMLVPFVAFANLAAAILSSDFTMATIAILMFTRRA